MAKLLGRACSVLSLLMVLTPGEMVLGRDLADISFKSSSKF